jgi:hypothetical protein
MAARSASSVVHTSSGLPTRMPHAGDRPDRLEQDWPPEQAAVLLAAFSSFSSGHHRGTLATSKSPHSAVKEEP